MSTAPDASSGRNPLAAVGAGVRRAGGAVVDALLYVGGVVGLFVAMTQRVLGVWKGGTHRIRIAALVQQAVRVGVRAIPIIALVQIFIGVILALAMARPLDDFGQIERVSTIVALAMFREMGALISAVILSGFAGAAIAAELGAMVEGEEIKALRSHALDPIRFLVVPRVIATTVMLVGLTVIANIVGVIGGALIGIGILEINPLTYLELTREALTLTDYYTGLLKAAVFGSLIAGLACYEGLNVKGGAEGVGRATTTTVVKSIVGLIATDCVFAIAFYQLGYW
jgi:phospholipid/cholesterol/gamma-HCH transport system permease protein